ncbi:MULTISPECIES: helix-turn-helix domain-containing protein [Lactobacillaceae]|uniref:winged helix-turn-helix transcriptional regulator n=1 Tax=Lactobacillaceae TaxID=33958 RepID=UPI001456972B|nr:winged helix-turn-helix transcriptional regulator [Lactobacillus sp. HBUAS51381]NLR09376.1 helix-turn-helix transcriptional regulator [Lactobacillus sp. HBUAS51381]
MALTQLNLGSELGLEILHQRWYALILYQLAPAPTDFMDLRVTVRGISTFNLLLRLKHLTEWGLVETLPEDDYSYRLTANGKMFHQILLELEDWGNDTLENNLAI